jgi:hypothetical protein
MRPGEGGNRVAAQMVFQPGRGLTEQAARELPQALTLLALISAAFNLDRALGA